jgi:hypothetical protein
MTHTPSAPVIWASATRTSWGICRAPATTTSPTALVLPQKGRVLVKQR